MTVERLIEKLSAIPESQRQLEIMLYWEFENAFEKIGSLSLMKPYQTVHFGVVPGYFVLTSEPAIRIHNDPSATVEKYL